MGALGLGCSGLFGDLAPDDEERCYPSCLAPNAARFYVERELATMPEAVTVTVCRGGSCELAATLPVHDADKAPGGQVEESAVGAFSYAAYFGGASPRGTLAVSISCVECKPFSAGEQIVVRVESAEEESLVVVRATLNAVTKESPRTDGTVERDCPDVERRTCQELRPSYETLE